MYFVVFSFIIYLSYELVIILSFLAVSCVYFIVFSYSSLIFLKIYIFFILKCIRKKWLVYRLFPTTQFFGEYLHLYVYGIDLFFCFENKYFVSWSNLCVKKGKWALLKHPPFSLSISSQMETKVITMEMMKP